jgi:hypothetical protein
VHPVFEVPALVEPGGLVEEDSFRAVPCLLALLVTGLFGLLGAAAEEHGSLVPHVIIGEQAL